MANELEGIIDDDIEELGVDAVIEHQREQGEQKKERWESWVALSSSLLAVLSAIGALMATFAADKAAIAESEETVYAAYEEGADASYNVLRHKMDILIALGQQPSEKDRLELTQMKQQVAKYQQRAALYDKKGGEEYQTHDFLAIAVTLFQVAILLGGLAIVIQRPVLFLFGMTFAVAGLGFEVRGLIGF